MNFWKHVAAFAAIISVCTGYGDAAERHHHHKSSSNSCCKSVKKSLHKARNELDYIAQLNVRLNKVAPRPITQKKIDKEGGTLTLTCPGDYCVTENITGTIIIDSNSVCLDLCCHTLDADGAPNAIIADGHQGLKVFDGRIINSTDAAILVTNYSAVELFKLVMNNHALDAIRQENSLDLNVHDVDFINEDSGERALLFDTCDNIVVNHCNASGFLSTLGAILELNTCNDATVQDVNITNCTKTSIDTYYFTAPTAFVFVGGPGVQLIDEVIVGCTNVHFERVRVNNNTINNTVTVTDPQQVGNWMTFEAIQFSNSTNCSLHGCQTSNNTDIAGSVANVDTEDYIFCLLACESCTVTEHQSNNNSCPVTIPFFFGGALFDSNDIVVDRCQFNSNSVENLAVAPFESIFMGLFGNAYFYDRPHNVIVRNTQANFNTVSNGGAGRDIDRQGVCIGMDLNGFGIVVDNCQANNNSIGDSQLFTAVFGIESPGVNVTISQTSADNNTGGEYASGIVIFTSSDLGVNQTVVDCSASSNGNYGLTIGFQYDVVNAAQDLVIENCVFNNNGGAVHDAAGIIAFTGVDRNTSNILIKGCQVYDTFATSVIDGSAAGIKFTNASNVVIEDTNVYNTTSDSFAGHGIVFDTVSNSKIIRTQVHGNQDSGLELTGVNTNVAVLESIALDNDIGFNVEAGSTLIDGLFQQNRALGNTSIGFSHAAVLPAPFDTGYQNNYAQDNGPLGTTNYSISNVIQIHTYSIPTATYVFTSGGTNFPTQTNIDAS